MKTLKLWIIVLLYHVVIRFSYISSESLRDIANRWSERFSHFPICDSEYQINPETQQLCVRRGGIPPLMATNKDWPGVVCLKSLNETLSPIRYLSGNFKAIKKKELKLVHWWSFARHDYSVNQTCSKYALYVEDESCIAFLPWNDPWNNLRIEISNIANLQQVEVSVNFNETQNVSNAIATPVKCNYTELQRKRRFATLFRDEKFEKCPEECNCIFGPGLGLKVTQICDHIVTNFSFVFAVDWIWMNDRGITEILPNAFVNATNMISVFFQGNKLKSVPYDLFYHLPKLIKIHLERNLLTVLDVMLLRNLTRLSILNLYHNLLETIPLGLFNDCSKSLELLQLSHNRISFLPDGVFHNLSGLYRLTLANNSLTSLPSFPQSTRLSFLHVANNEVMSLQSLRFSDIPSLDAINLENNSISTLPNDFFVDTLYLINLYLGLNFISKLSPTLFSSMVNLESLDLHMNELSNLPSNVFEDTSKLWWLDLSFNNLSTLHADIFRHLVTLVYLDLSHNQLKSEPPILANLTIMRLGFNRLAHLGNGNVSFSRSVEALYVEHNLITELSNMGFFKMFTSLHTLDLQYNGLKTIKPGIFIHNTNLQYLLLQGNRLTDLEFIYKLYSLKHLQFSHNQLRALKLKFDDMRLLAVVDFSDNMIEMVKISFDSFSKTFLDLRQNSLSDISKSSFNIFNFTVLVDDSATCCFVSDENICLSANPTPVYLTCNRMLGDTFLRVSMWLLGLFAIIFNGMVFVIRAIYKPEKKIQCLLILHLSISDFLMGINMVLIAGADLYFGDVFPIFSEKWRTGVFCKLATFLSIISSEVSVLLITFITADRYSGVKLVFGSRKMELRTAKIILAMIWFTGITFSVIPAFLSDRYTDFYENSEVCVGIPLVRRPIVDHQKGTLEVEEKIRVHFERQLSKITSYFFMYRNYDEGVNEYFIEKVIKQNKPYATSDTISSQLAPYFSIAMFIGLNFICFICVAIFYILMFVHIKRSAESSGRTQSLQEEMRRARKMFFIVFTDFCTWIPLCTICILAQLGVLSVSPVVYAWVAAFVLPINSALNPFLYTLNSVIDDFRRKKKQKLNVQ